jgi:hypothetical protein
MIECVHAMVLSRISAGGASERPATAINKPFFRFDRASRVAG